MSNVKIVKKPLSEGNAQARPVVKKKRTHENSLIPGVTPDRVRPSGRADYSEESLEAIRKDIPNPPSADPGETREKAISQVELLMLKGITNQAVIAQLLKLSSQTASNYVRMVHARWEVLGSPKKHQKVKGESISKLTLIENELWTMYSNLDKDAVRVKVTILSQLQQVVDRKMIIAGLSPRMLEAEANNIPSQFEGHVSPTDMIQTHQKSLQVLTKLLGVMSGQEENGPRIIDAESS